MLFQVVHKEGILQRDWILKRKDTAKAFDDFKNKQQKSMK